MNSIPGITWKGGEIDDPELISDLPDDLAGLLGEVNGFIVHHGAIHVRGACRAPVWHSLRTAWRGNGSFHSVYPDVQSMDIPFAQDQLGDQFLLRKGAVLRLSGETGEIEPCWANLDEFVDALRGDVEEFFDVGLDLDLEPGHLIHAWPPFCVSESEEQVSLKPISATELTAFHADFARQIRDVPDGQAIRLNSNPF